MKKQVKRSEEHKRECRSSRLLLHIGIVRDDALCFYYQKNLRLLEFMRVGTVMFNPISGTSLPSNIDGMTLGGDYPELHVAGLASSTSMGESIKTVVEVGMPYLAECGGFFYLHRELGSPDGSNYPMMEVIDRNGYWTKRPSRFDYISLMPRTEERCLLNEIKGRKFRYQDSTGCREDWIAQKLLSIQTWSRAHNKEFQIARFSHLYHPSDPDFLKA